MSDPFPWPHSLDDGRGVNTGEDDDVEEYEDDSNDDALDAERDADFGPITARVEIPKNPHILSQWVQNNVLSKPKYEIKPKGRMFGRRSKDFPV